MSYSSGSATAFGGRGTSMHHSRSFDNKDFDGRTIKGVTTTPIVDRNLALATVMSPNYETGSTECLVHKAALKLQAADEALLAVQPHRVSTDPNFNGSNSAQRQTTRNFKSTFAPEWANGLGEKREGSRANMGWQRPLWPLQRLDWKEGEPVRYRLGVTRSKRTIY